jgi:hypothetical protein
MKKWRFSQKPIIKFLQKLSVVSAKSANFFGVGILKTMCNIDP